MLKKQGEPKVAIRIVLTLCRRFRNCSLLLQGSTKYCLNFALTQKERQTI
jgi:hypothetical protein